MKQVIRQQKRQESARQHFQIGRQDVLWKAGRSEPSVDSLKKLADHFGVPMEYFLEGKKEKEPTLNDIRKENGLKPIPEGDVVLTKA